MTYLDRFGTWVNKIRASWWTNSEESATVASVATPDVSATKGSGTDAVGSDASAGGPSASTSASTSAPTELASAPNPKRSVVTTSHSACSDGDTGGCCSESSCSSFARSRSVKAE